MRKDQWIHFWTAEQPFFKHYAQVQRLIKRRDIIGNTARSVLFLSENGLAQMYVTKEGVEDIQEDGRKLLNKVLARKTIKDICVTINAFWENTNKIRLLIDHGESIHSTKLVRIFKKYNDNFITIIAYVMTTWEPTSFYLEKRIKEIVSSRSAKNIDEKIRILFTPRHADLLLKEKISLLNVKLRPTQKNILEHMLKFSFLFTNIDSESDCITQMQKRLNNFTATRLRSEINVTKTRLDKLCVAQQKIFKELKSPEAKYIAQLIQELGLLRLELKNCWAGIHYSLFGLFENIADETRVSIREVMMFWSMEDILSFLESGEGITGNELAKRKEYYVALFNRGVYSFYSGQEAIAVKQQLLDSEKQVVTTFKGNIANKGKARGKVRIINFDDLRVIEKVAKSIKEKFILVTGMTNPNSMQLIKMAKAIITDEGGVTCHAAIISREYNIPCIISTRIATQILRDNDLVEVDANQGIVKIIKHLGSTRLRTNDGLPLKLRGIKGVMSA